MKEVGWIPIACLLFMSLNSYAQPYMEVGFGVGVWHESHILNAQSKQRPLQGYTELGTERGKFSITAFYDFNSSYVFENYQLSPIFYGFSLNREILEYDINSVKIKFLASIGGVYESHHFIDNGNANVPGYELHEEDGQGLGYCIGLIPKMYYRNLVLSTQFHIIRSNQKFIAGQFESQTFQTGSNRILVSLAYQFRFNENPSSTCPTYF